MVQLIIWIIPSNSNFYRFSYLRKVYSNLCNNKNKKFYVNKFLSNKNKYKYEFFDWFSGFVYAEGTFGYKYTVPYFQIA